MSKAKYHHLVPRVYLRPWCYKNDSIYVLDKGSKKIESKNINNNFGKSNFHSLQVGMPILNRVELKEIFEPLKGYDVYFEETRLEDYSILNDKYYAFDEWIIKKEDRIISKRDRNEILSSVEGKKIIDIEKAWATKYEDKWNIFREDLIDRISKTQDLKTDAIKEGFLMKFIVGMNWRGFLGNKDFTAIYDFISGGLGLKKIQIPDEERYKKYLETADDDEMKNYILLKRYREFLNDKGYIYEMARQYIRNLEIKFYIAEDNVNFITSDNPSFITENIDKKHVHVMPITPKVLACIGKSTNKGNEYFIELVNNKEVRKINDIIFKEAFEKIIMIDKRDKPTGL